MKSHVDNLERCFNKENDVGTTLATPVVPCRPACSANFDRARRAPDATKPGLLHALRLLVTRQPSDAWRATQSVASRIGRPCGSRRSPC
jgi:hypothetical protein